MVEERKFGRRTFGKLAIAAGLSLLAGKRVVRAEERPEELFGPFEVPSPYADAIRLQRHGWSVNFSVDKSRLPKEVQKVTLELRDPQTTERAPPLEIKRTQPVVPPSKPARPFERVHVAVDDSTPPGIVAGQFNNGDPRKKTLLVKVFTRKSAHNIVNTDFQPLYYGFTHAGIKIFTEPPEATANQVDPRKIEEFAKEVDLVTQILPPEKRISHVYLRTGGRVFNAKAAAGMREAGENQHVILGETNPTWMAKGELHRWMGTHEAAHTIHMHQEATELNSQTTRPSVSFKKGPAQRLAEAHAKLVAHLDEYSKRFELGVGPISVFDESTYFPGIGLTYGHPYDNPGELFASATSVMRYWPQEFVANVKKLQENQKQAQETALQAARAVLDIYGDHAAKLFPKEVIDYVKKNTE